MQCPLLNCPAEVLLLIAHFLSTPDLASFVRTNSALYALGIPALWSHLYYKSSPTSTWYVTPQEILDEEYLGLQPSQRPPLHYRISEICRQRSTAVDPSLFSTVSLPSRSLSSYSDDTASIMSSDDDDTYGSPITNFTSTSLTCSSNPVTTSRIDHLSLALLQNSVSRLATSSIKSLIISTDYRFGQLDQYCPLPLSSINNNKNGSSPSKSAGKHPVSLSFVEFLKYHLLTTQTVPNLQHLRITHANPVGPPTVSATTSFSSSTESPATLRSQNRIPMLASVVGEFLQKCRTDVRLSLDCATLAPVQAVLDSTPQACEFLHFLHVEVLPSQYRMLAGFLDRAANLKVLSIKSSDFEFGFHDEVEHAKDADLSLFFAACRNRASLRTLTLKSVSLIECFTPEYLPPKLTHLELEADFHQVHSIVPHLLVPSTTMVAAATTATLPFVEDEDEDDDDDGSRGGGRSHQFPPPITLGTNLWAHIFSSGSSFGQLETLKVRLWNPELLFPVTTAANSCSAFVYPSDLPAMTAGNLREIHLDGDYVPPGLDAYLFAKAPRLRRVHIPVVYGSGAYALAANCPELEELTVFGVKSAATHSAGTPDFLECRLLRVLGRCRQLRALYLNAAPGTIRGSELLALLRACPRLQSVTIEQTDFTLPHHKAVVSEYEEDEFGGFGMLPLELIKQRLPLYNRLRTTFVAADTDGNTIAGLSNCLAPIDGDEATRVDPKYKQYYSTLAYQRCNCIFRLDIPRFLALNAGR